MGIFAESHNKTAGQDTNQQSPWRANSPLRSRSKSRLRQRARSGSRINVRQRGRSPGRRSRSAVRGGGSYGFGGKDRRSKTICWFGKECRRTFCWYSHPEGRHTDQGSLRRGPCSPSPSAASSSSVDSAKKMELDSVHGDTMTISPRPETWLSFRDFVLQKLDDSHSLDEALSGYESFQAQALSEQMEQLKSSGLLFDLYSPIARAKQSDLVVSSCRLRAKRIAEDMGKQRFAGLRLLLDANSSVSPSGTCQLPGHLQAPYFAFDPRVNAVEISKMAPEISVGDINLILLKLPGFLSASSPRFSDDRVTRTYYAHFETAPDVEAALKALSDIQSKSLDEKMQGDRPCFALAVPAESLASFVLPPVMSAAERIQKDLDFTREIVCKLDGFLGVPSDVTDALLSASGSTEMKLDLQVMYLRRVHCFCFYSCEWCNDEWDLFDRCGAGFLRSDLSASLDDASRAADSKWAATHEGRIQEFLAKASFQKASLPCIDEEPFISHLMAEIDSNVIEHAQGKHQCAICGKCFRERHYAQKHLRKIHTEIQDIAFRKACTDVVAAAYLADPKRPGWPPARKEMTGSAEGGA